MIRELTYSLLNGGAAVWGYMTAWFVAALVRRRNDLADIAWGLGFVLLGWLLYFLNEPAGARPLLVNMLVTIWGLRLAIHVYLRNRGRGEDYRYRQWREDWGKWFVPRTYLQVFLLQGLLLMAVSLSVVIVNTFGGSLTVVAWAGARLWLLGFVFETLGDYQLLRFTRNPANQGKIMNRGLWRYTRHPNYFGEITQWWGLWVASFGLPLWWIGIVSPLTITFLILKVSGIPMLEKKWEGNPEWEEYKRRTSAFIPWLPKK